MARSPWLYYLHPYCAELPSRGRTQDADVIIAFAFGRNTYRDDQLDEVLRIREKFGNNDLATVRFLQASDFDAGLPNWELASQVSHLAEIYEIPAIVQWEVAAAFEPEWYAEFHSLIHPIWPLPPPRYTNTLDILSAARAIMETAELKRPLLLDHARKITRTYLLARKALECECIVPWQWCRSFDPDSKQPHTTSWLQWWFWDTCKAKPHHLVHRLVW